MTLNKQKINFLLILPALAWPFLCFIFYSLGGGSAKGGPTAVATSGVNPELPVVKPDPKQAFLDKLKLYEKAEHDSTLKAQYQRQDPYRQDSIARRSLPNKAPVGPSRALTLLAPPSADPRADRLLAQLDRLKQGLQQQPPEKTSMEPPVNRHRSEASPQTQSSDDTAGNTRITKLNEMLDKVIRIQHPTEAHGAEEKRRVDEVRPADSGANAIAATIPANQILSAGTTIALRITDSISINGQVLAGGQMVYGTVNINNDRLTVHISSLRTGNHLYSTDLQVYDLDGIVGIHIPAELGRDVAKQSADQGVNSLNVLSVDPSLGAQAATAGIQTVKTFVGRKVRQVRVTVRAGYQVLLKNTHVSTDRVFNGDKTPAVRLWPPGFDPGGPILTRCTTEGLELTLRSVSLERGYLWFGLELTNHAAIGYTPAYARWYIRDRRRLRRTAMQELPVEPGYTPAWQMVTEDSVRHYWTGFSPFAIGKDKELVLEIGEKGGGRTLSLAIDHRTILNAKTVSP